MALADSGRAIGAVTNLVRDHLLRRSFLVSVGKPEDAASNDTNAKLNLFLYEVVFDSTMRNLALRDGEPPPLWLVLKYLLTAFDDDEDSDSAAAHELLGRGLSALQELSFVPLDTPVAPPVVSALENNPEPLKLTLDESSVELLSKIMQGTDEHYRLSVAFQIRPVMIVPPQLPRGSLLVGIDYTQTPQTIIGPDGVQIDVLPSLGARLKRVEPDRFEVGATLTIHGDDLMGSDHEVALGNVMLQVVERRPDRITAIAEGSAGTPIADGGVLSAGEMPLVVRRRLSATRTRTSNLLAARLLPSVTGASLASGTLTLTGFLLGADSDDVTVLLYRPGDGATVRLFDTVVSVANQQTLTVANATTGTPAGTYRVILRVNGQQAFASPSVIVP
jgi:hypothetical protein